VSCTIYPDYEPRLWAIRSIRLLGRVWCYFACFCHGGSCSSLAMAKNIDDGLNLNSESVILPSSEIEKLPSHFSPTFPPCFHLPSDLSPTIYTSPPHHSLASSLITLCLMLRRHGWTLTLGTLRYIIPLLPFMSVHEEIHHEASSSIHNV